MLSFRTKMLGGTLIAIAIVFFAVAPQALAAGVVETTNNFGLTSWRLGIFNILSSIGAFIAWIGGSLLDASVGLFTVGMVNTIIYLNLNTAIESMWAIIRDLFNILFIFGLIFAGFKIILDANDSGSKKTIGSIVVAALLINFSLYVTQVIVDFSNVAAHQINQLITTEETTNVLGFEIGSLSNSFTRIASMDTLGDNADEVAENSGMKGDEKDTMGKAVLLGFMFLIFYTILGFVLGAGAVILFTRFFALIFIMIFSPIMFIGFIFPKLQKYSSQWWGYFFNQALIGPAFIFMLYLTLSALQGINTLKEPTLISYLLYLLIVTAFLWASLLVAKSLGAYGGAQAVSLGQNWGRSIRGGVSNFTAGKLGRNTFGRMGDAYNRRLEERGVKDNTFRRRLASSLASNKFGGSYSHSEDRASGEKASVKRARYDQIHGAPTTVAGVKIPGRRTGGLSQAIVAGAAAPAGSQARIDMERKITGASNEQIIEMLGKNKPDSETYKKIVEHMSAPQFEAVMKAKPEELDDGAKVTLANGRRTSVQAAVSTAGGINKASDAQLKVLGAAEIQTKAADLKQSQFDDIMKSKDYTETERNNIKEAREAELLVRFENDPPSVFTNLQDKDIASLPKTILLDDQGRHLPYLSGGALRKIAEDDKLNEGERHDLLTLMTQPGMPTLKVTGQNYLNSPQGQERYG